MKISFGPNPEAMRRKGDYNGLITLAGSKKGKNLRIKALKELGRMKNPEAVPAVIPLLSNPDPAIKKAASDCLVSIGSPACKLLISFYARESDTKTALIHETLLCIGKEAVNDLIESLQTLPVSGKEQAVYTLVEIGESAVPDLIAALADSDPIVRDLAEVALDKIGIPAVPYLIRGLTDKEDEIQARCATILICKGSKVVPHLIDAMRGGSRDLKTMVFFILQQIGDTALKPLIISLKSPDHQIVSVAREACIGYGPSCIDSLLLELLTGTNASRHVAGTVLIRFGSDAVQPLAQVISQSDDELIREISGIFSDIGKESISLLIRLLHHEDNRVVQTASDALAMIGSLAVRPLMETGAGKEEPFRLLIRDIIRNMGDEAAAPLSEAIEGNNPGYAAFAIQMIKGILSPVYLDVITKGLYSSFQEVREESLSALDSMGSSAVERLISLLSDSSDEIRMHVQSQIIRIGKDAVPALLAARSDPDIAVSADFEWIIGEIGKDAVPALVEALMDDEATADTAKRLLTAIGVDVLSSLLPMIEMSNPFRDRVISLIQTLFRRYPEESLREFAYHTSLNSHSLLCDIIREVSDDVTAVFIHGLHSSDEKVSEWCSIILVLLSDEAVIPLIESIRDKDESYGLTVTSILVQIGKPGIVPLAASIKDPKIRLYAVAALGMIGEAAIESLIPLLSDEDEEVVSSAGLALGKIGSPALPSLIPLFFTDTRYAKIVGRILQQIGTPALPPLIEHMQKEEDTRSRHFAILIATVVSIGLGEIESLCTLFQISDTKTGSILGNAFGLSGVVVVRPLLKGVAAYDKGVPQIVSIAIKNIGSPAVPYIIEQIQNYHLSDRHVIPFLFLLTIPHDPGVIPLLRSWYRSPDSEIRTAVVKNLEPFGSAAADIFTRAMDDDPRVKLVAVEAMGTIGLPVLDSLLIAMKDSDNSIRSAAVVAIAKVGMPAQYMLIQMLSDSDRQVRHDAAVLLSGMRWEPKYTTDRLAYLYASEDWDSLVAIGPPAIEILQQGMSDSDLKIKAKAKECLSLIQKNALHEI
ncbi:MAG: HEAT repeat domain-containing protein [Methanospirillaceae archaeon]|nr:HEAT repeat domain-containing protein [Methanospirillaceae archaeon]